MSALDTYALTVPVFSADGVPAPGVQVSATLTKADYTAAGVVLPRSIAAISDDDGVATLHLVSNLVGTQDSRYRIAIRRSAGHTTFVTIQMPEADSSLQQLVDQHPITPEYSTSAALSAAQAEAAKEEAQEAAQQTGQDRAAVHDDKEAAQVAALTATTARGEAVLAAQGAGDAAGLASDANDAAQLAAGTASAQAGIATAAADNASASSGAAALAEGAALNYRNEARQARDEASAIVYGGYYSVEPAAGSVPISRPDSTLHPDWIAGEYSAALVGHISYAIDIAHQAAGAVTGGEVRVAAGAADRPSICLAANPGTGIFFPADDEIAFAINGVEVLHIDSSGIV